VTAAEVFEAHRGLLFGLAYRMLGSVAEAEDVLQEAWLRWDRDDRSDVADPRAYLARITTTAALDHLRSAAVRHERYVGPWLPEPLLTGPDVAEDAALADSVSMAIMVVLETLSPLERAVFVLREAFGFSYAEIGETLGRSEAAARQLGHRAREHVQARRPRFRAGRAERRAATEGFLAAALGGDLGAMLEVLAPDVTLVTDGGGRAKAALRPIQGADKVARFLTAVRSDVPDETSTEMVDVNGEPGILFRTPDGPFAVALVETDPDGTRIAVVRVFLNPDKLAGVR
jgi:RNA polymerase sigma-70 factor (ECF subfamily)